VLLCDFVTVFLCDFVTVFLCEFVMMFLCEFVTDILGTVDYVWNDGTVVFRTCPQEQGKVVFQIVSIRLNA